MSEDIANALTQRIQAQLGALMLEVMRLHAENEALRRAAFAEKEKEEE